MDLVCDDVHRTGLVEAHMVDGAGSLLVNSAGDRIPGYLGFAASLGNIR